MPSRVLRPTFGLVALAAVLFGGCSEEPPRWNVLLVTLDTTRRDAVGCYGRPGATPRLEQLAAEGVRFDLAISTSGFTPISHAAILTGRDNRNHGLRVSAGAGLDVLPSGTPTLATILREHGYRTFAFTSAFTASSRYGFDQGFDVFDGPGGPETDPRRWDLPHLQRRADDTTDRALARLSTVEEPFLLWAHYFDPHDPFHVPPPEELPNPVPLTPDGLLYESPELYAAEVRFLDRQLGRVLDALRSSGAYDRTIVVVVADHGEGMGDHGWPYHGILYQEQIHVPLVVRVPGGGGVREVDELVRTTDVVPTVLDYLGLLEPGRHDGATLRPLIEGRADAPRVAVADAVNGYDENCDIPFRRPADDFLYCATDGRHKLIYRPSQVERSELFDLAADPHETRNLFAPDAEPAVRLLRALAERAGFVLDRPRARLDPWTTAALESLGYVGARAPVDPAWSFRCPEHRDAATSPGGRCPICAAPSVPFVRPKG